MGWLIGLPLGIFRMLAGFLMLALRLAVPIALVVLVIFLLRRAKKRAQGADTPQAHEEPEFHGPVYTVDYEEVRETSPDKEDDSEEAP